MSAWLLLVWLPEWRKSMTKCTSTMWLSLLLLFLWCFWKDICFFSLAFHVHVIWPYEAYKCRGCSLENTSSCYGRTMSIMLVYHKANYLIVTLIARGDMGVEMVLLFSYILMRGSRPQLDFQRPPYSPAGTQRRYRRHWPLGTVRN